MDMAERNGPDLRRLLRSADRFSESAICRGLRVNTLLSRSSALLRSVTRRDQRRVCGRRRALFLFAGILPQYLASSERCAPAAERWRTNH